MGGWPGNYKEWQMAQPMGMCGDTSLLGVFLCVCDDASWYWQHTPSVCLGRIHRINSHLLWLHKHRPLALWRVFYCDGREHSARYPFFSTGHWGGKPTPLISLSGSSPLSSSLLLCLQSEKKVNFQNMNIYTLEILFDEHPELHAWCLSTGKTDNQDIIYSQIHGDSVIKKFKKRPPFAIWCYCQFMLSKENACNYVLYMEKCVAGITWKLLACKMFEYQWWCA